jgi:hypothetical protein
MISLLRRLLRSVVRDLGQHAEQGARDDDWARIPQSGTGLALGLNLGRALRAQREVMRGAEVRGHP